MKKRIISLLLAFAMFNALCPSFAFASNTMRGKDISEWTTAEQISAVSDKDLIAPIESAEYYAEFFIRDLIATGITSWDESTHIIDSVAMYDETGESITAYSFKLNKGYIIVAASVDIKNPILEWSDEAEPLYDKFDASGIDKIVYVGGFNYFVDRGNRGNSKLETLSGNLVARANVSNTLQELKNISNVSEPMLDLIVEEKVIAENKTPKKAQLHNDDCTGESTPGSNQYITDPFAHASTWYGGGTFTCYDYANS